MHEALVRRAAFLRGFQKALRRQLKPPGVPADHQGMTTATAAIFQWRDSYSVRIPQIDEQHKRLIALINDLHSAMLDGRGKDASAQIIEDLVNYTKQHFQFEEAMLAQKRYSGLTGHREAHRMLVGQVEKIRTDVAAGRLGVSMELMRFLKDWLANHILSADMAYSHEIVQ
jgi:hemerythrin